MDKKILNLLNKWKANNLITESAYQEIIEFESNSSPTQKSKVAKAITLIGSLFLLSGLLGTLPLIWNNLTYWAQLLLLVVTTVFLIYAANYSEKFEDKNIFIFKSSERVSSVLFLISTISFGSVIVFSLNIINNTTGFLLSEDIQILIVSFMVLIYSANYSEKFEDENLFIFKSSDRVSSVLYLISTISFASAIVFTLNILNTAEIMNFSDDSSTLIVSFFVLIYAIYLYIRTGLIFQHIALFYTSIFFLGSLGNLIFPNIEPWAGGLFLFSTGLIWGLYTLNEVLKPSWLGYLLSSSTISIGSIFFINDLVGSNNLLEIILLILGSIIFVWGSIQLSEQVIFFIGGLGLIINLPRLITELLPDNIWPPLILFMVGGVLVAVGLYLNSIRENLKINAQ